MEEFPKAKGSSEVSPARRPIVGFPTGCRSLGGLLVVGCLLKGASSDNGASVVRYNEAYYLERLSKFVDSTSVITSLFGCKVFFPFLLRGIL